MTKEELKPIDTSKYKITETGQVLKMTKDRMNLNDYETTLNGQPVVYSDSIDSSFPDTRSKNQKKKDRKEYFKRKRKMPRLTKREWYLVNCACHCLYDSLDVTNGEIKDRRPDIYKENKKDMKTLDRIMAKIEEIKENE